MGCGSSVNATSFDDCYTMDAQVRLGRGQYAIVAPGVRRSDDQQFAVKKIQLKRDRIEEHRGRR